MQNVLFTVLVFKPQLPASNFCGKNQELLLESLQELVAFKNWQKNLKTSTRESKKKH